MICFVLNVNFLIWCKFAFEIIIAYITSLFTWIFLGGLHKCCLNHFIGSMYILLLFSHPMFWDGIIIHVGQKSSFIIASNPSLRMSISNWIHFLLMIKRYINISKLWILQISFFLFWLLFKIIQWLHAC
jgi:hypothetical protein